MSESLNTSELVGYDWRYHAELSSWVFGNTPFSSTFKQNGFSTLGTNQRVGFQNPFWKDQCRQGINATTSFIGIEYTGDLDRSYWTCALNNFRYWNSGSQSGKLYSYMEQSLGGFLYYPTLPSAVVVPSNVVSDVHNRCVAKFIDEVNAAQSSENLTGRSIKHFKHDVHSLIHPMAGVQDQINHYLSKLTKVSNGKSRGPGLINAVREAYLEFEFGVKPFTDDISAIYTDMVIKDRKRNPSVDVMGYASARFAGSTSLVALSGTTAQIQPYLNMQSTSVYQERIKGAVRTGINDDGRLGVIQDNRLLPKDWLPTAFSILPYAWMVNYFTNCREIIDAASFRYSDVVWGCQTSRVINTVSYSDVFFIDPISPPTPGFVDRSSIVTSGGNASFTYKKVNRYPLSPASLVPSFEFRIPTSTTPWLNMMAAFSPRIAKVVSSLFT